MPRLIAAIVRHAAYRQLPQTPSALQPFPLTREGEDQARQVARLLDDTVEREGWALWPEVDSSQQLRAWQTARIIMEELSARFLSGPRLTSFETLAERSVGSAANLTTGQIEAVVREDPRFSELPPDWKSNSHFRLPLQGAESLMEAGERVAAHLDVRMAALVAEARSDTLKLFVGHGASFRHAAHKLGVLEFGQIARLSMYHTGPIFLEYQPGGVWQQVAGEWKIRGKNSVHTD